LTTDEIDRSFSRLVGLKHISTVTNEVARHGDPLFVRVGDVVSELRVDLNIIIIIIINNNTELHHSTTHTAGGMWGVI